MDPGIDPMWRSPAAPVRMEHPLTDITAIVRKAINVCIDVENRLWLQMSSPTGRFWITTGSEQSWWSYNTDREWIQYIPDP